MHRAKNFVCVVFSLFAVNSLAGAWDVGSFDNDSALDWVYDLQSSYSVAFLVGSLNVPNSNYLQMDTCTAALAASEIVAAFKNKDFSLLPAEAATWARKHVANYESSMAALALTAIRKCSNINSSELAETWEEAAGSEWKNSVDKLKAKLQ